MSFAHTDVSTFPNLRQHEISVVLQGSVSQCVTRSLTALPEASGRGVLPC